MFHLGHWETGKAKQNYDSKPEELPILFFPIPASDMDRKSIKNQKDVFDIFLVKYLCLSLSCIFTGKREVFLFCIIL